MNRRAAVAAATAGMLFGLICLLPGTAAGSSAAGVARSMWVWTDEITDPLERQALVDRAFRSCITRLYVSVYRFPPNSDGDRMYERADLGALIALAHQQGIEVWAAYGNEDWPELAANADCTCKPSGFVWDRVDDYNNFNSDPNHEDFDGWMFDVEPSAPDARLIAMYACTRPRLDPASGMGAAIRHFWHDDLEYPCGSGTNKALYRHVVDLSALDVIVPMCYRDFVGNSGSNGILDVCDEELLYAEQEERLDALEIGLETKCGLAGNETFCEEGAAAMRCAISELRRLFGVRGFALHQYLDSLSEAADIWPENDLSACEVETLMLARQGSFVEISWPPVAPAVSYDVILDDAGVIFPVACGTTGLSVTDGTPVSPGEILSYVQRIRTQDEVGDYGISTSCVLRAGEDACP